MIFMYAIVIDGDGACANVDMLAQSGITNIAEVMNVGFRTNIGVFDFSKVTHTYITCQVRAWTTMTETTDTDAIFKSGFFQHGIADDAVVADGGLINSGAGSNTTVGTDARFAGDDGAGQYDCIHADFYFHSDIGSGRINDGDAIVHVALEDATAQELLNGGELDAVVNAHGFVEGAADGDDGALLRAGDGDKVSKVVFSGGVARQVVQSRPEPASIKAIDAGINFADAFLFFGSAFHLDDLTRLVLVVTDDTTEIRWQIGDGG